MVRMLGRGLFAMVTVTAAAGTACRDSTNPLPNADVTPPVLGTLVVSTSTTGAALDPDGYTVTVDGTLSQPVGTSGSVTFDSLVSGPHRVELAGVAENCTVIGANPQTDPASAGDTAPAAVGVSCASGPPGSGSAFFSLAVPGVEYLHSGLLTTGDIAKASY